MSRATSFNIRKLIRIYPDENDDEEAFECSSARSIRMQHELEQDQSQHTQKARHDLRHRSWMNNPSGPQTTHRKKPPEPIAVIEYASSSDQNSGMASRRISTPLPLSSLSGRTSPRTPLSLRSSEEDLSLLRGKNYSTNQRGFQHLVMPGRTPKTSGSQSPQFPEALPSAPVDCNGLSAAPLISKLSVAKPSSSRDEIMHWSESEPRARGYSLSSIRQPSPSPPPPPTRNSSEDILDNTLKIITTSAKAAINRSNRSSYVMDGRIQQPSAFVNGQPSPPLEPDDVKSHVVDSGKLLQELPAVSNLSLRGERTWFNEDVQLSDASDNVQQLIWETDEAFKAVSYALAEARQATHSAAPFKETRPPLQNLQQISHASHKRTATAKRSPTVDEPQAVSPISPTPGAGCSSVAPHRKASRVPSSLSSVPHIIKSPLSTSSVSKSKKGSINPQAKAMRSMSHESSAFRSPRELPVRGTGGHRPHHSYHKSISRLNLAADKVTDKIFDGRNGRFGFTRVEADEVVTPEQVELFRRNRIAKQLAEAERESFDDILRSAADGTGGEHGSDADVEPLHLQDLPAHSAIDLLSPVIEVATPDSFQLNKGILDQMPNLVGRHTPAEATKEVKVGQDPLATPPPTPPQRPIDGTEDDESMNWKTLRISNLSNRRLGHKRSASSTSHIASLPTIPEVKITAPQGWDVSRPSWQQEHKAASQRDGRSATPSDASGYPYFEEDEEHMFFMSNNITNTMPAFQHGRIRLAKADLVHAGTINSFESKLLTSPDETLDWTAFQMAILGGAGDLFSDPDNFLSRDAQEEMVDDLCDWFEDLGFSNGDLGMLVTTDKPRRGTASRTPPGLKRWTLEGHPKRYQGAGIDVNRANSHTPRGVGKSLPRTPGSGGKSMRASIDSLPQSPMLELRMMTGVDGNKEFVSMGYNLNHDLGDFLKWESEHVYAPGFYGSE
ncbi:hypothetical protein N0V93_003237 [Gnomoniopsis smithogilvyi]|uniref:Uncharacterized protein n=1 Tax=Gnomoniopsis smithogilvyi TaxID=1191159 RepID=A0A9W8YWA1_9PEZI|nr:hypothetical protein N0V93_003237 [Gnomoniopsis smithogilvyi]